MLRLKHAIPRKFFGRRNELIDFPFLVKVPTESFENFIQFKVSPLKRKEQGLEHILKTSFPFQDTNKNISVEYIGYEIGNWECNKCGYKPELDFLAGADTECPKCKTILSYKEKYTSEECKEKGLTYSAPLRIMLRLRKKTKSGDFVDTPKKIYFGEMPMMTPVGTFVINGSERVVVNQLIRSPGIFYSDKEDRQKEGTVARTIFTASIHPDKGSRIEFELSTNSDVISARIDKKRISAVSILRAFGLETAYDILSQFYEDVKAFDIKEGSIIDRATGEVYKPEDLESFYMFAVLRYTAKIEGTEKEDEFIEERYIEDINVLNRLLKDERVKVDLLTAVHSEKTTKSFYGKILVETLINDTKTKDQHGKSLIKISSKFNLKDLALRDMYVKVRSMEGLVQEIADIVQRARSYFDAYFRDIARFDLSKVGRVKINAKIYVYKKALNAQDLEIFDEMPLLELAKDYGDYKEGTVLTKEIFELLLKANETIEVRDYTGVDARFLNHKDLINAIKYLLKVRFGKEKKDDIAHLGNRRVRPVGELLENQARIGIARMLKSFRDKVATANPEDPTIKAQDLVNSRYLVSSMFEFLKGGQLSQYLDNANPLSSLTHRRRLSALGPGGLTRESAKFEIRDVHPSHYGRLCPIETPEGQNIGLVTSMTTYAQTNDYGFLVTPYRKVVNGIVTNEVEFLAAYEEENFVIAQSTPTDQNGKILSDRVIARYKNDIQIVKPSDVNYIDVSPRQIVSVSASLIPFLEHDDANRALMGSNMQRQAVPLIFTQAPLIGTGMESKVAVNSGSVILAKRGGVVEEVDADTIVVRANPDEIDEKDPLDIGIDVYKLLKYIKTNQSTSVNQRPIVYKGQKINKGDCIADGQSTFMGELALGKDLLVCFMPWRGYNFEDAIVISERLVKEDVLTSIHIEELKAEARETKMGDEEITRQIPGVPEKALAYLDEYGIVKIGTYVKYNDILVGKVTPIGDTQQTPEQKLLQAIFGEKSKDVKDSSLRCPTGLEGVVVDVQVFTRKLSDTSKSPLVEHVEQEEKNRIKKEQEFMRNLVIEKRNEIVKDLVLGKVINKPIKLAKKVYEEGTVIDEALFESVANFIITKPENFFSDKKLIKKIEEIRDKTQAQRKIIDKIYDDKIESIGKQSDLPSGIITMVKVYIAQKRKIRVGDKMAGRHGNKGVISVVLPVEDMPFLPDGTPVDVVLNPLGVPSRMNVGQILETHLGMASKHIGKKIQEMMDEYYDRSEITDYIASIYAIGDKNNENKNFVKNMLKNLSDEEFKNLVGFLAQNGIPMATPAFEGCSEEDLRNLLKEADLPQDGKFVLYDGRTGEPFDFKVTTGYMHMLKLIHMVEDKIHARSTGPYSLVTQQPLGGRAQFGGQRLGEMEVWALEAHGAAYTLQEMLTVKSDDIEGRNRAYESIVKGKYFYSPGIPESFKVLVRELKSLGLNVMCENGDSKSCDSIDLDKKEEER